MSFNRAWCHCSGGDPDVFYGMGVATTRMGYHRPDITGCGVPNVCNTCFGLFCVFVGCLVVFLGHVSIQLRKEP